MSETPASPDEHTPTPAPAPDPAAARRPSHPVRRALLRLTFISGVTLLGLLVLLWLGQRLLIYPGASMDHPTSRPLDAGWQTWTLALDDVSAEAPDPAEPIELIEPADTDVEPAGVPALLRPGDGATAQRPGPAVVFLHGNGEIISQWAPELQWYTRHGVTVLIPEYRGYHRAAGRPSQRAIAADLRAFVDRLGQLDYVDADRLIYHGRSMGGGFAAQLLAHRPPAALILASSFTSFADAAADLVHVPRFLVRDPLPVTPILKNYPGPTLILHGTQDRVVSVDHAHRNAAAAQQPTLVLYPDTGHNTMPRGHGDWSDIADFLAPRGLLPRPFDPGGIDDRVRALPAE